MNKFLFLFILPLFLVLHAYTSPDPNVNDIGKDELKSLEVDHAINQKSMAFHDLIYVPIYSDIYMDSKDQQRLLSATLSIRNTSFEDDLFISKIDYYNTAGDLVRKYLEKSISLPPMGTINYVVEKEDDTGGSGANFIIELSGPNKGVRPLVQAIMIESSANKAFAFSTDGYSIK